MTPDADLHFHFDPVCPYAWITSRWVQQVVELKEYTVDWRFISLRLINSDKDYERDFPAGYEHGHTAGLRMLRVAAAVRNEVGRSAVGEFYTAAGESIFDRDRVEGDDHLWRGTPDHLHEALEAAGLPTALAAAADDTLHDEVIGREGDEALRRTGRDVGTPIIVFRPPDGPALFGPVISRIPHADDAVALWDSVIHLATFPGFAELKRSLRERPQLRAFGQDPDPTARLEDWKGGSRRS
ncbi:Rv2466c family mycothiol-dependent reductase [soil metagenome]